MLYSATSPANDNTGAADALSRELAEFHTAVIRLESAVDKIIAAVNPENVTWVDVARLKNIVGRLNAEGVP